MIWYSCIICFFALLYPIAVFYDLCQMNVTVYDNPDLCLTNMERKKYKEALHFIWIVCLHIV